MNKALIIGGAVGGLALVEYARPRGKAVELEVGDVTVTPTSSPSSLPSCGGFWGDVYEGMRRKAGKAPSCTPTHQATVDAGGAYADDAEKDGVAGPLAWGGADGAEKGLEWVKGHAWSWVKDHALLLALVAGGAYVAYRVAGKVPL